MGQKKEIYETKLGAARAKLWSGANRRSRFAAATGSCIVSLHVDVDAAARKIWGGANILTRENLFFGALVTVDYPILCNAR